MTNKIMPSILKSKTKIKPKLKLGKLIPIKKQGTVATIFHPIIMRFYSEIENDWLYNVNHNWYAEKFLLKFLKI